MTSFSGLTKADSTPSVGRHRWVVVALLFAAVVINYIDRQAIGLLKGDLAKEFAWSESNYADLVFWFQASYALSYLLWGAIMDRIGARWGFGAAFLLWQLAQVAHAGARSFGGFVAVRLLLGAGEAGVLPGSLKAIVDWFPKMERAFAAGFLCAGTNIGAIVTPLVIPAIALAWGWRGAFVITGLAGLVWLPIWLLVYRRPRESKWVSTAELAHIESDPPDSIETISWLRLIALKGTWAYSLGKFLIDPIWWMFLFWLPDFLGKRYGLNLKTFGLPLVVIYLTSDLGGISGGWLSSHLIRRGWSINWARKTTMLICAIATIPVAFAANASNVWLAVAIIGLATAAHQGFSATLYTLPSDIFPRSAVGSVLGFGGMIGAIGGMAMAKYAGWVLDRIGSYTPIFVVAASAYLLALLAIHLLAPKMDPVQV